MSTKKADVILHPIRMRIIQALVRGNRMTAQQLQELLKDVPQATLYRHLKKMIDTAVLVIVDEIPNRGTIEKVYMLPEKGAEISYEELLKASSEDHLSFFMNYVANIIGEYGRYLDQSDFDLLRDGVSYRQYPVYLTEEENLAMLLSIKEIIVKAMQNEPDGKRRRRVISVIDFPEASFENKS